MEKEGRKQKKKRRFREIIGRRKTFFYEKNLKRVKSQGSRG